MSAESLLQDSSSASRETLLAALREAERKLREAVALGNKLYDEREQLNARVDELMDRDATSLIAHKRELSIIQSNVLEAARERDSALRQLEEATEEIAVLEEQVKRARDDLKAAASTNTLLRDDYQSKERENDVMRRKSVMHDTMEEDNARLRSKLADTERLLQQSRAAVSALQAQNDADRAALSQQSEALKKKSAQLAAELEHTKREAATEIGRLRKDLATANAQVAQNADARRSGGSAPSLPALQLGLADVEASVEYDAFTARTRGRSMARLGAGEPALGDDASARLLRRRRNSDLEDEDVCSRSMARFVSATPAPSHQPAEEGAGNGSGSSNRDAAPAAKRTPPAAAANGSSSDACPHCGRSGPEAQMQQCDTEEPAQRKSDKGCPCVVM